MLIATTAFTRIKNVDTNIDTGSRAARINAAIAVFEGNEDRDEAARRERGVSTSNAEPIHRRHVARSLDPGVWARPSRFVVVGVTFLVCEMLSRV